MKNEKEEMTIVQVEGTEMQILREKAEIDVQISTAHAFPRNMKQCLEDAVFTATMDVDTAMTCGYSVPRGGKAITGPSTHLAKIIMQNWGNFRAEARVVNVSDKFLESEAVAWDLQKNVAVKVIVKRSIMQNKGKDRMSEDMIVVTGNAANSIAIRNAIFSVIPKGVTETVYKAAQQKVIGDASDLTKKIKSVLTAFKKTYDKDEADVLKIVGKTNVSQITPDDLMTLIGVGQALKDGDTTPEMVWKKTPEEKKQDLKDKKSEGEQGKIDMP